MNFATRETCRRCDTFLPPPRPEPPAVEPAPDRDAGQRSFGRWLLWILGVTTTILMTAYVSLLVSSEGVTSDERRMVREATLVLEDAGFVKEASALRYVVSYRTTDNWWNDYVGHPTAYAATNFPFAVITLYPAFFKFPVDATERATILLHEAHHLFGAREEDALRRVWIEKRRLGWTSDRYSHTRVWKNTHEWTQAAMPALFMCGVDRESDCVE